MKFPILLKTFLCTFGLALCTMATATAEKTDDAVKAAEAWLALVDAGDYGASWQAAAPFFQERVKENQWVEQIAAVRRPLGKTESRELIGAQFMTALPGAPDGEYVVIQFKTRFANKEDSVETITPMKADGLWRVSGYFIR